MERTMISLISFIIVLIGAFNWFCIGVLQYDFIAGIFGSQANIFSRLVYAIVGFSAIWLIYATIKQRGKVYVNGKKENDKQLLGKLAKRATKSDKNNKDGKEKIENTQTEENQEKQSNHDNEYNNAQAVEKEPNPKEVDYENATGVTEHDTPQSPETKHTPYPQEVPNPAETKSNDIH